jgi:hypothetical protein
LADLDWDYVEHHAIESDVADLLRSLRAGIAALR